MKTKQSRSSDTFIVRALTKNGITETPVGGILFAESAAQRVSKQYGIRSEVVSSNGTVWGVYVNGEGLAFREWWTGK